MASRHRLPDPDFINKTVLAHHLGCTTTSVDNWIAQGSLPAPHSRPGRTHAVWLRAHYEQFRDTGEWPPEAWGARNVRKEA